MDDNVAMTYVLRHELVNMYAQHKFSVMRQELLKEEVARQRALEDSTVGSDVSASKAITDGKAIISNQPPVPSTAKDSIPAPSTSNDDDCPVSPAITAQKPEWFRSETSPEPTPMKVPKGHPDAEVEAQLSRLEFEGDATEEKKVKGKGIESALDEKKVENENEKYARELNAKLQAISADSLGIVLNANCFIDGFECDVDPAVALKDEESARGLANFLYKQALVGLTEQVRSADLAPLDSEALVDLLHAHGVNMRYLGRLAVLACEQEQQDQDLLITNRQKIQAMPCFWLEMLEIEVMSRCVKHHLNGLFRSNHEIKQCFAPTIASLLNFLFGSVTASNEVRQSTKTEIETIVVSNGDSKKKKKNKNKSNVIVVEDSIASSSVPDVPNACGSRTEFLESLQKLAKSKFCLQSFALMFLDEKLLNGSLAASPEKSEVPVVVVLSERISRLTLLRRICQV